MCAQSKLKTFIGQAKCLLFHIKLECINSLGHRSENSLKAENITYKTPHNHYGNTDCGVFKGGIQT